MKKLHFSYDMYIEYSIEVARCNFTIKCIPVSNERQKIEDIRIGMFPSNTYNWGKDGLNNTQIYGVNEEPHYSFRFHIDGVATTGLNDFEEYEDENLSMIFRHPHGLNVPGEKIKAFFNSIQLDDLHGKGPLEISKRLMAKLFENISYVPGATNFETSAEEAFEQGKGVCQDYAHILISLLHLAGITARYVTGVITGEGQSHGWVEVLNDKKWVGIDPTNNCVVDENYIKLCVGRDAKDCLINRGIMHGGGLQTQEVKVFVKEIGE